MKQVLLAMGVLLLVMLGMYWLGNRSSWKKEVVKTIGEKEIYFETSEKMVAGETAEVKLMANDSENVVVSYIVNFTYDPAMMKIENVEINKTIFDKKASVTIDEKFGKVNVEGENKSGRDKLVKGKVELATIKIKGLKKGSSMIYLGRRPEVGVIGGNKVIDGEFKMPNFKINFL